MADWHIFFYCSSSMQKEGQTIMGERDGGAIQKVNK